MNKIEDMTRMQFIKLVGMCGLAYSAVSTGIPALAEEKRIITFKSYGQIKKVTLGRKGKTDFTPSKSTLTIIEGDKTLTFEDGHGGTDNRDDKPDYYKEVNAGSVKEIVGDMRLKEFVDPYRNTLRNFLEYHVMQYKAQIDKGNFELAQYDDQGMTTVKIIFEGKTYTARQRPGIQPTTVFVATKDDYVVVDLLNSPSKIARDITSDAVKYAIKKTDPLEKLLNR